jgi:ATP-binding protein involved in chromosome partitioning
MSSFVCPKCGAETPIFSRGGTEQESESKNIPFIGRIPIEMDIRIGSDSGDPVVHSMPGSASAKVFIEMAEKVNKVVEEGV